MSTSGPLASAFAREGGHRAGQQLRPPLGQATNHYVGLFRGLGTTSKEPVCNKRNTAIKRSHDATHFAVGCHAWDAGVGGSTSRATYADPGIVYSTCSAPDKNTSAVDLRQGVTDSASHFRTEQRERFASRGPQPRDLPFKPAGNVHLGDDCPDIVSQAHLVHGRVSPDEAARSAALRSAGAGALVPTSIWPKPDRCSPIDGGPRRADAYDLGMASGLAFGRVTQNRSAIVAEANVRNPVLGVHIPSKAYAESSAPASHHIVEQANNAVPHLRSLGALRPHY